jgi:hypothetical protein
MESYSFDRDRIEAFDKQRHEIIHGTALGKPLSVYTVCEETLFYLMQTGMYLAGLVHFKYKLQIVPEFIGNLWQQT